MKSDHEQYVAILRDSILGLLSQNQLSIDALCKKMQTSRSQLHRKVKELTGLSTSLFIRSVKLERASELLEDRDLSVSEVAYQAGFNNPQELSKYFKHAHGLTPTQYRKDKLAIEDRSRSRDDYPAHDGRKSIVILPFENRSPDAGDDYLSDGITEEILFGLSTVQALKVMGRASSFYFRNSTIDVREIANKLKVDFLLVGSVQRIEVELRIIVQLISGKDGYQIWMEKFQRQINDLFTVQEEIAFQVVNKLKVTISPQDQWNKSFRKTDNIDAYQLYLQGRREFEQRKDLRLALHYFEQAKDVDPNFAYAHIGIAFTYIYYCIFISYPPLLALPRIKSAYESALQLDPDIPEAFIIEGWIHFYYNHQPDKAIASINKALAIQPESMDALRIKAYFYSFTGQNEHPNNPPSLDCNQIAPQTFSFSDNGIVNFKFHQYEFYNSSDETECVTINYNEINTAFENQALSLIVYSGTGINGFLGGFLGTVNAIAGMKTRNGSLVFQMPAGVSYTVVLFSNSNLSNNVYNLDIDLSYCDPIDCPVEFPVTLLPENSPLNGTVGKPFRQDFTADGGSYRFSFAASSPLPPGLTFTSDAFSATLSGIPSVPAISGGQLFSITARDAYGCAGEDVNFYLPFISP